MKSGTLPNKLGDWTKVVFQPQLQVLPCFSAIYSEKWEQAKSRTLKFAVSLDYKVCYILEIDPESRSNPRPEKHGP